MSDMLRKLALILLVLFAALLLSGATFLFLAIEEHPWVQADSAEQVDEYMRPVLEAASAV